MKTNADGQFLTSAPDPRTRVRASTSLVTSTAQLLHALVGVRDVRVLHRAGERSKFFIVVDETSVERVESVVTVMVQLESAYGEQFDYDVIDQAALPLVPTSAPSTLRG